METSLSNTIRRWLLKPVIEGIHNIMGKLDDLKNDLADLDARVTRNTTLAGSIKTLVIGLNGTMENMQKQIDQLVADQSNNVTDADVADLRDSVAAIKGHLDDEDTLLESITANTPAEGDTSGEPTPAPTDGGTADTSADGGATDNSAADAADETTTSDQTTSG